MKERETNDQMASSESRITSDDVVCMAHSSRRMVVDSSRASSSTHRNPRGKVGRWLAISVVTLMVAACSPYYTSEPGPGTPPAVVGIEWVHENNAAQGDCLLGLTEDGLTAVAAAGTPFQLGGIAAEWLTYSITGDLSPVGAELDDCWNALANNGGQFALYLKCYGEPYIKYWFDNFNEAEEWVALPLCKCNVACQNQSHGAWMAAWYGEARREQREAYCLTNYVFDLTCGAPKPNGWLWGRHGVGQADMADTGTTEYPPLIPEGPLPSTWNDPWWDTSVPVPTDY